MVLCGVRVNNRSLSAVRPAMSRRAETVRLRDTVPRRSTRVLAKLAEWHFLSLTIFWTRGYTRSARHAINRECLTILDQQGGPIVRQGIRQAALAQLWGWPSPVRLAALPSAHQAVRPAMMSCFHRSRAVPFFSLAGAIGPAVLAVFTGSPTPSHPTCIDSASVPDSTADGQISSPRSRSLPGPRYGACR